MYADVVTLRNDIFVFVHPFMTYHFYCGQACAQNVQWHMEDRCFPSSLSMGGIPEGYSPSLRVTPEEEQKSSQGCNGEELDITLGCHHVYPWCISTQPQWVVEQGGTNRCLC